MAFLEEIIQNSPWLTRDRFSEPDEAERELWRTGKLVPAYISKLLDSAHLCRPDVPSMSNGDMVYRSAPLGDELHQTTLAVAWTAADIYALEPASGDAIAEAAADLADEDQSAVRGHACS